MNWKHSGPERPATCCGRTRVLTRDDSAGPEESPLGCARSGGSASGSGLPVTEAAQGEEGDRDHNQQDRLPVVILEQARRRGRHQ